ncbi:hypothetical protein C8F04DRAFT_1265761 [Mycena alexandri]|uniref:Uncharacterized protein n=1 Tax=Mycena alexandri TaxID=1745969 RepID=A0AAD6WXR9_9AGAR|nr:hypothetical protein C8F04DRAFT_1265761 [Mycena alexandri]
MRRPILAAFAYTLSPSRTRVPVGAPSSAAGVHFLSVPRPFLGAAVRTRELMESLLDTFDDEWCSIVYSPSSTRF